MTGLFCFNVWKCLTFYREALYQLVGVEERGLLYRGWVEDGGTVDGGEN